MRRSPTLLALGLMLCLAAGLSACRGSDAESVNRARADAAAAAEAAQRAQVLAALEPLNPLRYHQLDAIIRDEDRIPADAVIWATRARETLDWVDWPPELMGHVEQYAEWLDALLAAFHEDDAHGAGEPSKITHALAHTFEAAVEAWLSYEGLPPVPPLAGLEPPTHDGGSGAHGG